MHPLRESRGRCPDGPHRLVIRAEARRAIPTWVWVLALFIVARVVFYVATMWAVPAKYRHSPTFGTATAVSAPATPAASIP